MENQNNPNTQDQQQPPYSPYVAPPEVKKWNWGSFMFNIWWGIGHKVYLPLLCLIPLFNLVWVFVCGAKGNEWAWKTGQYATPEELKKSQESWSRAGLVYFIVMAVCVILYIVLFGSMIAAIFSGHGHMEPWDDFGYDDYYDL
ncbi:ribonuclease G [Anaerovorax odorimutans]|uniref:Ribonuclease G n=1 Tax=Anaerovorax odorimutans TaxID=109327 RepID=A0ABT1RST2_9FIRM|nr:ribonuclease G [Anaerovorax odorimutans]MCQ4638263.1 ribonuclease G [Anaerovorax odorimutans]